MNKNIFVILGSPNSPQGELSAIAKSRLDYFLGVYSPSTPVICTGGWGEHFNIAEEAHAVYAQRYLTEGGVLETDLLEAALSANTVDDAVKVKAIISKMNEVNLTVITSDYHLERAKLVFETILNGVDISYVGVQSNLAKVELDRLIAHEKKAVAAIVANGLYY